MKKLKILITGKNHPHKDEVGYLTGKLVTLVGGSQMAEVELQNGGGCFISRGEVKLLDDFQSGETAKIMPISSKDFYRNK